MHLLIMYIGKYKGRKYQRVVLLFKKCIKNRKTASHRKLKETPSSISPSKQRIIQYSNLKTFFFMKKSSLETKKSRRLKKIHEIPT